MSYKMQEDVESHDHPSPQGVGTYKEIEKYRMRYSAFYLLKYLERKRLQNLNNHRIL